MATANVTTDHETIRNWVEAKGGCPAQVKRTGKKDDVGIIRIDYPDIPVSNPWKRFHGTSFLRNSRNPKLAFLYQDERDSRFSKVVKRDTAAKQGTATKKSQRSSSKAKAQKTRAKRRTAGKKTTRKKRARG